MKMDIELSLDEIIEKRRKHQTQPNSHHHQKNKYTLVNNNNYNTRARNGGLQITKAKERIFDARDKIIQNTRARMLRPGFDARHKLNELRRRKQHHLVVEDDEEEEVAYERPQSNPYKYVRLGLPSRSRYEYRGEPLRTSSPRPMPSRYVAEWERERPVKTRIYKDYDNPVVNEEVLWNAISHRQTQRIVHNIRPPVETIDLGIEEPYIRTERPSPRELEQHAVNGRPTTLSERMRARLNNEGDTRASHGIYANESYEPQPLPPKQGYRIVVSNLHTEVSTKDIYELFSAIAHPQDARIVRPGVAEVIYNKREDAEDAVSTYHNRHFDGKPMNCLLAVPRSTTNPIGPAIGATRSSRKVDVDMDAVYSVLFKR